MDPDNFEEFLERLRLTLVAMAKDDPNNAELLMEASTVLERLLGIPELASQIEFMMLFTDDLQEAHKDPD